MGGSSKIFASHFKEILDEYQDILGGLVNKRKSQLYGWNYLGSTLREIATTMDFTMNFGWKSFKYVGVPIRSSLLSLKSVLK